MIFPQQIIDLQTAPREARLTACAGHSILDGIIKIDES
jgi:hypothetical protein